jgi:hypothetical protein
MGGEKGKLAWDFLWRVGEVYGKIAGTDFLQSFTGPASFIICFIGEFITS